VITGGLIQSKNQTVKVDLRDLEKFNQMLQKGNIGTLQKGNQDHWSDERRQAHTLKCEKGGGFKVGQMTVQTLQDHRLKGEQAGASKVGAMAGQTLQDRTLRSEKGGGCKVGPMTGQTLEDHGALISQGAKDRHELLLTVANGLEGGTETWTCEASRAGNAVLYLFRTSKPGQEPIRGVRKCVSSHSSSWMTPTGLCRAS